MNAIIFPFLFLCVLWSSSLHAQKHTNALIEETSPYLLQHAHNPVNWYPWGEEALAKAKNEDKLLLVSIGYSACHWCHVMEHETFENEAIANYMNANFVCVKVDREERPDIDRLFMNAAQLTSGNTGWPLNAFALPDGSPFYGATYFEPKQWTRLLEFFVDLKKNKPEELNAQAKNVRNGIISMNTLALNDEDRSLSLNNLILNFDQNSDQLDQKKGGRKGAPKFPTPSLWEYLLQYSSVTEDTSVVAHVNLTLTQMAKGGIYDAIGGGFSRYSTDENWIVPHFEKMLYDNAQLVSLYTHAWQKTKNPLYKTVVFETLDFIAKELTATNGGFYASLDADSENEEGVYYTWAYDSLKAHLGDDSDIFAEYYSCTKAGNWENGLNILYPSIPEDVFLQKHQISKDTLDSILKRSKKKLREVRENRMKPGLDYKQITAWNAIMLSAYCDAYRAFKTPEFLEAAIKNLAFLEKNALKKDGSLTRSFAKGKASIPAFLDDYAFLIAAYIDLYQATFDYSYLSKSKNLTDLVLSSFFNPSTKLFNYTANTDSSNISQNLDIADNVIPSSNSEMAKNMLILGHYFEEDNYLMISKQMLLSVMPYLSKNVFFYSNWEQLEILNVSTPFEIAIVGEDAAQKRVQFDQHYLPFVLFYGTKSKSKLKLLDGKYIKGQTTIYVCRNKTCLMPVTEVEDALELLKN